MTGYQKRKYYISVGPLGSIWDFGIQSKMQRKQLLICLLTGYLVLLLNFGDSLHRMSCFGLHHHAVANGPFSHHASCHCHLAPTSDNSEQSDSVNSDHDCAFCKFFDQYHGTPNETEAALSAPLAESFDLFGLRAAFSNCSNPSARGPPLFRV